ncbi:SERINE/THREONINE-PROTEIN KINASE [Salix viminalis]|uniref:SERINE/THREONINE-PROTEIN KINASE n=1 Tax=Salix viminalis TaxID=40686 RepID=A0A9Q0SI23_SALVM|nr:SERINE/THREONINE-PROTEIN KINASE [Salix viminalis]
MESLRRKRKGLEVLISSGESLAPLTVILSRLSLGDYSRQRKKYKEAEDKEAVGSSGSVVKGVFTAPPCSRVSADPPCRGLKRKIGCIEVATQLGRKKKIEKEYDLGAFIGQGKFGSVVLCRSKGTGEEFACKMLRKKEELVHREVEIMQHLSGHPGVVTLKAVYEDAESFYLVMELCTGGRLLDQMAKQRQYPEQRAASILKEVVSVIKYCHDMGQSLRGAVGSPAYVAPEVLAGEYSEKVDIWSAGVLLHTLLVGVLPFLGDSLDAVFEAIKNVNLDFKSELWESVSQPARELVSLMLTRDVSARLTADEILGHPWILFHTEPTQKEPTKKPKFQDHATLTSQQPTVTTRLESERYKITASGFLSDDSSLILSSDGSRSRLEEQDCGLVDALTVAISRVRISEPKRSRLCWPTSPIRQECSSNIKINNLCTAF